MRDLEPLPTDPRNPRLMRAGLLSSALADRGHSVTWFTSSFDHYRKCHRPSQSLDVSANLHIRIIQGLGYSKNLSLRRILHNRLFAEAFERAAETSTEMPDVIAVDLPTTEAASAAVSFGRRRGIPTVLSVRDLWPDFFTLLAPPFARRAADLLLTPLHRQAEFACREATSVVGISEGYLRWGREKGGRPPNDMDIVIPLGYRPKTKPNVDSDRQILNSIGVSTMARVVAFVGSWGHTYNLELVYQLAAELSARSDILFVLAGDGPKAAALKEPMSRLGNVLLPGWLDQTQIAALLRRSDVGLLPYEDFAPQGLPNKAFEYLAYGAYQISTIQGELNNFYEQGKFGVALRSPTARELAQTLVAALEDSEKMAARHARASHFEEHYAYSAVYDQLVKHICQVASGQPNHLDGQKEAPAARNAGRPFVPPQ